MNNSPETAKRPPGRPRKPLDGHSREARFTVNIPPYRVESLRRMAERQGLPLSGFMRQAILNRLDKLERLEKTG